MTEASPKRVRGIWVKVAVVAAAGVALAVACRRTPGASQPSRASLLEGTLGQGQFTSPAVWRYHPRSEAPLLARYELRDGKILFAGERGERWMFDKKSGGVRAAARLAPESLIAILHLDDGGWLFVGASGAGYEARDPLGGFVRTSAPLDKLARVSAAGTAVVGVTREGQLVRSGDAGASWTPVGSKDVRFVDVALADQNRGLALSVPEAAWQTKDGGATWKKLDVPGSSALGLAWDDQAGVAVQTALAWMKWDPGSPSAFSPLGRTPARSRYKLPARPERGPDAVALGEGRATVIGDEYIEVGRDDTTPAAGAFGSSSSLGSRDRWTMWRGRIGGRLVAKPIDWGAGCQAVRVAGNEKYFYAACARSASGANHQITFHRSDDGGKKFELETYSVEGRLAELELAVGHRGELAVTGICPPHNTSRGCLPYGVYYRRRAPEDAGTEGGRNAKLGKDGGAPVSIARLDGGKERASGPEYELAPAATPALKGSALALTFSPDGRTVFAVGRRTKGNSLVVFVSRDGGESFDAREIEQIEGAFDDPAPADNRWARPPPTPTINVSSVGAGEDGTLAIVVKSSGAPTLVVVDEEGRVVSFARAPNEASSMGAVGSRALAFSDTTRMAWETLDGGATWDPVGRLPVATCVGQPDCDVRVRCHVRGCVFGSELSRVGWHGQADDDQGVLAPVDTSTGDIFDRKARTPIACTLDEKGWQVMESVAQPPTASEAAIGKVAWYALAQDDRKAEVKVLHAIGGNKPHIEPVQLLAPTPKPNDVAYAAVTQVGGAAAIRYATPDGGVTTLKNVEVAWDNLLEGKVVKARIADAGPAGVSDYQRVGAFAQRAQTNLLSIASGGVYLRIHYSQRDLQPTLFLDGRGTTSVPEVSWPTFSSLGSRTDMVHVGASHVPVSLVGNGAAVVRAKKSTGSYTFDAFATGLADPTRFGLTQTMSLAYAKNVAGLHVMAYDPDGTRRFNMLYPFRADAAVAETPIALPTQLDTGDKPSRCGTTTRADTPRVIVPFQGGSRHPVIVTDSVEPMRILLTGKAVMHGTPQEACVAAFDAEIVPIDPSVGTPEAERAIIVIDDLEHSWLFRTSYGTMGESRVEYRLINCRFDPAAEIPPEIYSQPGTRLRRVK